MRLTLAARPDARMNHAHYNRALPNTSHLDRLTVVLVSPRNPLNIGAAARAMANFGFSRLAVVAPYQAHWREAKSAVGAPDLLRNAGESETLAAAVADCTLVAGTASLTHRKPKQPVISLPDLRPIIRSELARGGRTALVFGSEKRGLSREDLAHCHLLVTSPTDARQPSMNLAQAVAVCLYELSLRLASDASDPGAPDPGSRRTGPRPWGGDPASGTWETTSANSLPPATSRDLDLLAELIAQTMAAANYPPAIMRSANRHDVHLLLRRLALSGRDARRILGLFRRILWRLQDVPKRSNQSSTNVPHK